MTLVASGSPLAPSPVAATMIGPLPDQPVVEGVKVLVLMGGLKFPLLSVTGIEARDVVKPSRMTASTSSVVEASAKRFESRVKVYGEEKSVRRSALPK